MLLTEDLYVVEWHSSDVACDDDESSSSSDDQQPKARECPNKFVIKAACLDTEGKSSILNIHDFRPYYYIKVPNKWSHVQGGMFFRGLKDKVKKWFANTLVEWKLVNAKSLYGFSAFDKFKYMKLTFTCLGGFYAFRNALNEPIRIFGLVDNKAHVYEQYESNIQPLLRFLHCHDLKAVGWLRAEGLRLHMSNQTHCDRELSVSESNITMIEREDIPPIRFMGFDIEADSSHGDFPLAKKDYQKLARDIVTTYNIVADEKRYNDMRPLVATCLKYAFHKYFNNNNILSVELLHSRYADVNDILSPIPFETVEGLHDIIDHHAPAIYEILRSSAAVPDNPGDTEKELLAEADEETMLEILDIFEMHFPEINTDVSDYYLSAEQLLKEYRNLVRTNNIMFREQPEAVVKLLLELVFDPYYTNLGINKVYNKYNVPNYKILRNLVPSINNLCKAAHRVVLKERKNARYRREKLPVLKDIGSVNDYVEKLTDLLNKYLPDVQDDRVIQIGSTIKKYGESDCYLKHIICLGSTEDIKNRTLIDFEYDGVTLPKKEVKAALKTYPELKSVPEAELNRAILDKKRDKQLETDTAQVIVECYDTEEEVLLAWRDLVRRENPDIIVGYNTFGFDYKYLYDRAEQLGITEEFSQLGRLKGVSQQLIEKKLQSAGLGDNLLHYIEMDGRISIDLYKVIQKMYRLDSYKLDFVCKKFLYQAKVDVTPEDIFIKQRGSAADRREVAEYCLIDCILCVRLMDKLEIIINNIGMAQVCSVPLGYLFLRGQGIKLFSYVAKICRLRGNLIPVLGEPEDEGKYEGAIVLEPNTGIHYEPVVVADFNSLYPSCIISENLSHNSFVGYKVVKKGESVDFRGRTMNKEGTLEYKYEYNLINGAYDGWDYVDIPYDVYKDVPVGLGKKTTKKIVVGHKICRFAQPPDGKKDIVPNILQDLLASRKKAKKMRDGFAKGSFRYNIYEGLQLAYKVTANSLYGIMGASTSQIRFREIAACTTAVGRKLINFSSDHVLRTYPGSEITYGDTDSIFCKFKCFDRYGNPLTGLDAVYKSIELCTEAAICISKQLKPPHNLEFEKAILPFILLSKKRYHGHYYTVHGSPSYYPQSMGIVLKRRDNAPIVKHVFGKMTDIIMKEHSVEKAIAFVTEECKKVLNGEFPMDMFVITKTLRSYYKMPDKIAHNVLAQRIGKRDPGNKPRGNDRIAYVYIVNPDAQTQGDMIETPEFIIKNKCKINYAHYITNQISKPILQILALANKGETIFDKLLQEYACAGYTKLSQFDCIQMLNRNLKPIDYLAGGDDEDSDDDE